MFHFSYCISTLGSQPPSDNSAPLALCMCWTFPYCLIMYHPKLLLAVFLFSFSDATPLVIFWNTTHSYGPDGPWPVVTVQIGNADAAGTQPLSTVDLYPGGLGESMILIDTYCNSNGTYSSDSSSPCLAEKAGPYNSSASETIQQGFTDEAGLVCEWRSSYATGVNGIATHVLDMMRIPSPEGTFAVYNSTISAVRAWNIELPDGTYYPTQVGTLSLGAPGKDIQSFGDKATGQTVPGYALAQGLVDSNSWGLHYGSASLGL